MTRRRLPDLRPGLNHKVTIQDADLYVCAGYYPDTQEIAEIFLSIGKQGSTLKGLLDSWAVMVSLSLQEEGNDLDALIAKFKGVAFEPSGMTTNPEIPKCTSLVDYVVRWIEANRLVAKEAT